MCGLRDPFRFSSGIIIQLRGWGLGARVLGFAVEGSRVLWTG